MINNKVLFLVVLILAGSIVYFHNKTREFSELENSSEINDMNSEDVAITKEFAESLKKNVVVVELINSNPLEELTPRKMLDNYLLSLSDYDQNLKWKRLLLMNPQESLTNTIELYNEINGNVNDQKHEIFFGLIVQLCQNGDFSVCEDFFHKEMNNQSVSFSIQLNSLKSLLGNKKISNDEKIILIQNFKGNHTNEIVLSELDQLETFIQAGEKIVPAENSNKTLGENVNPIEEESQNDTGRFQVD
jgi:hypothetical protein